MNSISPLPAGGSDVFVVQFSRPGGEPNIAVDYTVLLDSSSVPARRSCRARLAIRICRKPFAVGDYLPVERCVMRPDGSFLLEWIAEPGATYTVRTAGADLQFQDAVGDVRALGTKAT